MSLNERKKIKNYMLKILKVDVDPTWCS